MNLTDIIGRIHPAPPWEEATKIPWPDPEFSRRMLQNHLSQDHDWASRRQNFIDRQVGWIAGRLAPGSRILDLASGPGLYTLALAGLGHRCVGVDISPASIEYARERAAEKGLAVEYVHEDIRRYLAAEPFDCVMLIFGEFNVFSESDARVILANCAAMLRPGGLFILEGHTFESIRESGRAPASWWSCGPDDGILSARPHLCLQENYWNDAGATTTTRYFTLDAATGGVEMYCSSLSAYTLERFEELLAEAGFHRPEVLSPADWPAGGPFDGAMLTLTATRR